MNAPVITFLSDYGLEDDFVGVCHGVIAMICPAARVIDLTHGIARHYVRAGALILGEALPYLPAGVHLAVVDPDVGAERRPVALRLADGRTATFHGRDIFAPVAARLAGGALVAEAGDPIDPADLVTLALSRPTHEDGALVAHVRYIDRFGNVQLDADHEDLAGSGLKLGRLAELELGSHATYRLQYARTFADVAADELLLYEDAQRRLSVAVSHGDAAAALGLAVDDELRIRPA